MGLGLGLGLGLEVIRDRGAQCEAGQRGGEVDVVVQAPAVDLIRVRVGVRVRVSWLAG